MESQYSCSVCGSSVVIEANKQPVRTCRCTEGTIFGNMKASLTGQRVNPSYIFVEKANLFYEFSRAGYAFNLPSAISLSWHFIFIALELRLKALFLDNGIKMEEIEKYENRKKYGHNVAGMFSICVEYKYLTKNSSIYKILNENNEAYKSNSRNYRYYLGIQDIFTHSDKSISDLKTLQKYYLDNFLQIPTSSH